LLSPGLLWADAPAQPTDPQIAHIAYTAGLLDVEAGKQALEKSQNKDVRAFAQQAAPATAAPRVSRAR